VDDLDFRKVLEAVKELNGDLAQKVFVHATEAWLLYVSVEVYIEEFEYDDVVAAEVEAIQHLDDTILVRVLRINSREKLSLATGIVDVLLFVLADFDCDAAPALLHINAAHYLAKGTCIDNLLHQVAIAKLFAYMRAIEAISSHYSSHALNAETTNRVNEIIGRQLGHLVGGELTLVLL